MMSVGSLAMLARSVWVARRRLAGVLAGAVALALVGAAPALAEVPAWGIYSEVLPSYLPPGGTGEISVVVSNLGDAPVNGSKSPVVLTDKLPAGLTATAITSSMACSLATLQCTFTGSLVPYKQLKATIKVNVEEPAGTVTSLSNDVSVEGGGALSTSSVQHVTVNGEPTPFGVQGYELSPLDEDGTPATQAGSHPFGLTTTLVMNRTIQRGAPEPVALPRDLRFNLPPGLIGNPNAATRCTMTNFYATAGDTEINLCPPSSVVGVAAVTGDEPVVVGVFTKTVPVFNLVPSQGEPARFGFKVIGKVPIVIDTSVRTGSDYGVVASVNEATQIAGLLSSQVTLWGVPGDPRHDQSRGWECVDGGAYQEQVGKPCPTSSALPQEPFLTLPTSCATSPASEPFSSSTEADSWAAPGSFLSNEYAWLNESGEPLGLKGCGQLPFAPTIQVTPEEAHSAPVHSASTPTGLSVNVRVPQTTTLEPNPEGRAEADVKDTTIRLPEGVQLNPAAANELQACSEGQIGYERLNPQTQMQEFTRTKPTPTEPLCPQASKVGVVHIKTPLLSHELEGALYLAEPAPNGEGGRNPFNSLVALYLVAEDPVSGVLVKLAGEGKLEPGSGRVSTSFVNTPQLPFEDLKVELFGGERASVTTPALCGNYGTQAEFTPWSGTSPVDISSPPEEFAIIEGCGSSPLAFAPALQKTATNGQAGAFTPFTLQIARPDGNQALKSFSLGLPPGLAAVLASVPLCPEPQAAQGTCGEKSPESLIGHSLVSTGLGSEPYALPGSVYLTGPYGGAPFGLSSVTPLEHVGPFDLGRIVVRSSISIDPYTAAASIDTNATTLISTTGASESFSGLPEMIKGIPSQIKQLTVSVDRSGFQFNPTNCSPMTVNATLNGWQGASTKASRPFQTSNCAGLPFAPTLTASTTGHASKADGASLTVKVTSQGLGVANIAKVFLTIPKILPSRLQPTLQHACLEAVFNSNPAGCDEDSVIGYATVHTPILKSPLTGPAYVVSHGGAAFPDVEFVLQGEGVEIILDGKTDIKDGVTYSRFESAPDSPFTSFETVLPEGPHSILAVNTLEAPNYDLCGHDLTIPTQITGQNGAVLEQTTKVAVTGCSGVLASKTKLTNAQVLTKALKACRKKYTHKRKKRIACEKQARKRYAAKMSKKATKTKHHG
jgi:uncharacterized repeat protein (TIGR01451 family)